MTGIYFSGTGNTKRCVERFLNGIESGAETFALETPQAAEAAKGAQEIVFAYPVYYSNLPKIVREVVQKVPSLRCRRTALKNARLYRRRKALEKAAR